jgi:hypothetical protein
VVQLGAAGLVSRVALGDPLRAICCGVGSCKVGALPRTGDVGVAQLPRPRPLAPPRGVELRLPLSALDSKLTIGFRGERGVFASLCGVVSAQSAEWCGFVSLY